MICTRRYQSKIMESHIIAYGIAIIILIMFSAFFSATETAFSSINKIRMKNMANNGDKKAADHNAQGANQRGEGQLPELFDLA